MKHVLIVAFHYPPEASSSGVLRTAKFARYLSEYGWRVTVLTINTRAYSITDDSLLAQVPKDVNVVRTEFVELRKHFSIAGKYPALVITPDAWIGWYPYAVRAAKEIAKRDPFTAVYSTSPHATAHLIAQRIARSCRVPSVIDFRDPWFEDPPEPGTPKVVHWFAERSERKVIDRAAHVIASTNSLRDLLKTRYAAQRPEKFSAILNGFDNADFAALSPGAKQRTGKLVMLHAGSINGQFRDPRPLFETFGRLIEGGVIDKQSLTLRFLGPGSFAESPEIAASIAKTKLSGSIEFLPRVDYQEGLRQMSDADVLLLLQASDDTASLVPAKLYEYLRVQRPVLALVRLGATTDVLDSTGGGWCCDPADASALESTVRNVAALWRGDELANHCADPVQLQKFDRRIMTGDLAAILNDVTSLQHTAQKS